jgi:uncharacterized phage-associated protein
VASADDVAVYILRKQGKMTAMKLQKLVYYAQAWSLVWDEEILFPERIEAWANGPVVPDLYRQHRGRFEVSAEDFPAGDPSHLTGAERETIDAVLDFYGSWPAHELSELTHREAPWRQTRLRAGLAPGARGTAVISLEDLFEYYDGLTSADTEA